MTTNEMRIRATVVDDGATANIRKIQSEVAKVKSHPGLKGVTEDLHKLKAAASAVSGTMSGMGGLGATMAMGIGAGIGAGVAAAIASIDQLAKKTLELRHQSRSIGMQPDDIRAMEAVGKRFQIPVDQMAGGLQRFSDTFDEFRRRRGALYGELYKKQPELTEQLLNEQDVKKALGLYLSFLSKIRDPHAQRQWAEAGGLAGWERLFVEGADKFRKEWQDVVANMTRTTPDLVKSAQAWEDALARVEQRLDNLQRRAGTPVLGWVVTGIDSVIATMNKRSQEIDWFLEKMGKVRDALGYTPDKDLGKADLIRRKEQELQDIETTIRGRESGPGATQAVEERKRRDELVDELKRLREEMQRQREAQVQKSALEDMGGGIGSMIHRAALGGGGGGSVAFGMRGRYRFDGGGGGVSPGPLPPPAVRDEVRRRQRQIDEVLPPGRPDVPFSNGRGSSRLSLGNSPGRLGLNRVDPRLREIVAEASRYLPEGYSARIISGFRPGDPRRHGQGLALDLQLYDPKGRRLGNYQDEGAFRTYEKLAQVAKKIQSQRYPELDKAFAWGGYFSGPRGKYGALDTMHFDLGGKMGGGSWAGGLTASQRRLWPGAQSQGMGSVDAYRLPERERLQPGQLTDAARAAGVGGGGPLSVDTNGTVKIDLNLNGGGFAEGYKARATMDGIVGGVNFNRPRAFPTPNSAN